MSSSRLVLVALLAACGDNVHPELWPDAAEPSSDAAADAADVDASTDAAIPDAGVDAALPAEVAGRWRAGFGLPGVSGSRDAQVRAIVRGRDVVYVGGTFTDVAGVPARNVARWTGAAWQALGDGLPWPVTAMVVDSQGRLWTAGTSSSTPVRLARWDGAAWTLIPGGYTGTVDDMAVLEGDEIVIVGAFLRVGPVTTRDAARFDGRWHRVGTNGVAGAKTVVATGGRGFCLAGTFDAVAEVEAQNAACWDGAAWSPLGSDLPPFTRRLVRGPDGRFYAGGALWFDGSHRGLAVLDGEQWVPFDGVAGQPFHDVRAITWAGDDMYVGGYFDTVGADAPTAAQHIARRDSSGWHAVVGPVRDVHGVDVDTGVHALLVDAGAVWMGGRFSTVGDVVASGLARVDAGGPAAVLPNGLAPRGLTGEAAAIALDGEGRVVAGGSFLAAGTTPARNVARLGPSGWEPLGAGLDTYVRAVLVRGNGDIVAGGDLLAAWNGTRWAALGEPPDGPVHALVEDAGALYAAGAFMHIGGVAANRVARWDGDAWHPLGDGLDADAYALRWTGTELVAGGGFGARRWTGSAWTPVGAGVATIDGTVTSLAATATGLIVAGDYQLPGIASAGLARWDGAAWHAIGVDDVRGATAVQPLGDGLFVGPRLSWWDGATWYALPGEVTATALALQGTTLWVAGPAGIAAWDFGAP